MDPRTLAEVLDELTRVGELVEEFSETKLRCLACGHRCVLKEGQRGICKVRFNKGHQLRVPWGYVAGRQLDPIEKKPFFHVLPGSTAYSYGMLGCNFHCSYCQNWLTSQALRDKEAGIRPRVISTEQMIAEALRYGSESVISTYNEPLITTEWNVAVFKLAHQAGLLTGYVSNGYASPEVLDYLAPHLDLFKIDLKTFQDKEYRKLGGKLETVLQTIKGAHQRGMWVEIVTLLVPGLNDSKEELRQIAEFIASVSPDIPWHITAFHPDYLLFDRRATRADDLVKAAKIGKEMGLRYVYCGNRPGAVENTENTYCPNCGALLVERQHFYVLQNRIHDGRCPQCGTRIPGVWENKRRS